MLIAKITASGRGYKTDTAIIANPASANIAPTRVICGIDRLVSDWTILRFHGCSFPLSVARGASPAGAAALADAPAFADPTGFVTEASPSFFENGCA